MITGVWRYHAVDLHGEDDVELSKLLAALSVSRDDERLARKLENTKIWEGSPRSTPRDYSSARRLIGSRKCSNNLGSLSLCRERHQLFIGIFHSQKIHC